MTTTTQTTTTAAAMATALAAPADITETQRTAAAAAAKTLGDATAAGAAAAAKTLADTLGAVATPAAVKLAKRAADEMSGATKSRGGARADVLAVLRAVAAVAKPTAAAFVKVAAARLEENRLAKIRERETRAALAKTANDKHATEGERAAAFGELVEYDARDGAARDAAARDAFKRAAAAAAKHQVSLVFAFEALAAAYGVDSPFAAAPAAAATVEAAPAK